MRRHLIAVLVLLAAAGPAWADRDSALDAVKMEPKVVDAHWRLGTLVAAVRPDGTRRDGYAEYLCFVLRDHQASVWAEQDQPVVVNVIDAAVWQARHERLTIGLAGCPRPSPDADAATEIAEALKSMRPLSVEAENDIVRVVLDERQMTHLLYETAIVSICARYLAGEDPLAGLREVAVLNRYEVRGFVFSGNADTCRAILHAPAGPAGKVPLALVTRSY